MLSALSRSLAQLSGIEGLRGAVPAHTSMGRKLRGGQPARQTPSHPSHGELKEALTLPSAAHCLFLLLSAGLERFIHWSPASHFALQKGCNYGSAYLLLPARSRPVSIISSRP